MSNSTAAPDHPLAWKTVVKRVLAVGLAGVAIYLVLPKVTAVLGAWPRLSTLNPIWFVVAVVAEVLHFLCTFALQRLALQTTDWFDVVTSELTGNAITNIMPGSDAAGAAVQYRMLATAGSSGSRRAVLHGRAGGLVDLIGTEQHGRLDDGAAPG